MGVLDKILASKRQELGSLRARKLPSPPSSRPTFDLRRNATQPLRLLCEIKLRSPSAGALSTALSVRERARVYETCGASAISVLCDAPFFAGSFDDLLRAREGSSLPLLCKEFVIDECQLDAAHAYGASAVLLIVRCLTDEQLGQLVLGARSRQLVPLVEICSEEERVRALDAGATVIGVNARDLDTLQMDSVRAREVLRALPAETTRLHLSGVKTPADVAQVKQSGVDAALIGEILMRADDPGTVLRALAEEA